MLLCVAVAKQRVARDVCGQLDVQLQLIAGGGLDRGGNAVAEDRFGDCLQRLFVLEAGRDRVGSQLADSGKALVDSVNLNAAGPVQDLAVFIFPHESSVEDQSRDRRLERLDVLRIRFGKLFGNVLAEEPVTVHRHVNPPEPIETHLLEALSHRIANDQSPADHRRASDDAQQHGQMRPPVMPQTSLNESPFFHQPSFESTWTGPEL